MTGLVPVIHAAPLQEPPKIGRGLTAWMLGVATAQAGSGAARRGRGGPRPGSP